MVEGASTGAVCVEEKIKEKADGWHAGSALSLSLSFSFSFYLFSSLLLKHIEGGEKGNIKINCEPCRRFNDFK